MICFDSLDTICSFPRIKDADFLFLESVVSLDETRRALFSMNNYKSPGPDGFHPFFYKSQWNIIGKSIHKLVLDCFSNPRHIGNINQTLITLIPKCVDPSKVNHLRPIALCNVSYKIISKVISQRLKVISSLCYFTKSKQFYSR